MSIYYDRTPYTYLIGWTNLNTWYYGRRTKKGCHPNELWVKYFTSSRDVKSFRERHGDPDIIEVRKIFTGPDSIHKCSAHEVKIIRRIKAVVNPNWLNKGNAGAEFNTSMKVIAKNTLTGKSIVVDGSVFDATSEIVGINQGITFRTAACIHCNKEIPINNRNRHQIYCVLNPHKQPHPRTGVSLPEAIKINMRTNHADVTGVANPSAKKWKLTSPEGEVILLHGNLDSVLKERNLSRFNLLKYEGSPVPDNKTRTAIATRTVGWKLERV